MRTPAADDRGVIGCASHGVPARRPRRRPRPPAPPPAPPAGPAAGPAAGPRPPAPAGLAPEQDERVVTRRQGDAHHVVRQGRRGHGFPVEGGAGEGAR